MLFRYKHPPYLSGTEGDACFLSKSELSLVKESLDGDGQTVEIDEACGICLVVIALAEGGDLLGVEGVGAGNTGGDYIALIELEIDGTGDGLLGLVDEGGKGLP